MREKEIFENVIRFVSDLGQFHYKGNDFLIKDGGQTYIYNEFHSGEDGDSAYHTGILGQALAFRYAKINDNNEKNKTKQVINKILDYFKIHIDNVGHIGRNIVSEKAYEIFLPQHKNSDKEWSLWKNLFSKDNPLESNMRYKKIVINNKNYYLRYDVSVDQMISVACFLYWVKKFFPENSIEFSKAALIAKKQIEYYEKTNFKILDENGRLTKFGFHSPTLFPFPVNKLMILILSIVANKQEYVKLSFIDKLFFNNIRTYRKGFYLSKQTRKQFNNYMLTMALHCLCDYGFDLKRGLKNLINETIGENNYYSNAVSSVFFNDFLLSKINIETFALKNKHGIVYIEQNVPVSFEDRYGYNYWEDSAYRKVLISKKVDNAPFIGGHDILQAYWIFVDN